MESKRMEMPVSESELGTSVLGCRFSEKVDHLPIKKRRFLFRPSSPPSPPPLNHTKPSELTESREVQPPAASSTVTNNIDSKVNEQKLLEASKKASENKDMCGTSLVSNGIRTIVPLSKVKLEANISKLSDISTKENDLHISTTPSKDVALKTDPPTVDNSSTPVPSESETSKTQNSAPLDDRLNWDLNTVMDAWEESPESQECEQRSVSANIGNELLPKTKSLAHKIDEPEQEERKPGIKEINKLPLTPVNNTKPLLIQHVIDAVPNIIVKSEYPTCEIATKSSNDLSPSMATGLSLDYSVPPGYGPCGKGISVPPGYGPCEKGISGNNAITTVHNTEIVIAPSLGNKVGQSLTTFNEDDKAQIIKLVTEKAAQEKTSIGSLLCMQSSVLAEVKDKDKEQPAAVPNVVCSDAAKTVKTEQTPVIETENINNQISRETETIINKDVSPVENPASDIQGGSEVDNVGEFSVGYESQFEDGEMRELSIQTWEEDEEQEREQEQKHHGTEQHAHECEPETSSRIRSTDVGSQKGAEEISSVLIPEKPEGSDQVSGSDPNETRNNSNNNNYNSNSNKEVSMTEASHSDQWKMNVSGSDVVPENQTSVNSGSNIKDLSGIKFSRITRYSSDTEDLEGSRFYRTRDTFVDRGRFRMQQGCSSSNGDDVGFRRSVRRGSNTKFSTHVHGSGRGGGTWNHSPGRDRDVYPGPFRRTLMEDDNLTNEVGVDNVNRPFRNRMIVNREEDAFRARLGLRPSGENNNNNNNNRFVNVRGRSSSLRYGARAPRGRYNPNDEEYDEFKYPHSFPARRRRFSPPLERSRENQNHPSCHSGSTSPLPVSRTRSPISDGFRRRTRSRSRSRSPNLRIRRPRSPYGVGYIEPRENGFLKYKQRSNVFDRRSPPPPGKMDPPFYDSRKPKGRFTEGGSGGPRYNNNNNMGGDNGGEVGYNRRGGFVRRYDMGRPVHKHVQYDDEDGYDPPVCDTRDKEGLGFHGRGNPKPYGNANDTRFPRRPREER